MRSFASAIALLLVLGVAPVFAQDANVAGNWTGTFTRTGITEDFTLALKQDGQAVTGSMSTKRTTTGRSSSKSAGAESEDVAAKGTLEGNKLSLKIGRRQLDATIAGEQMTGTITGTSGAPFNVAGTKAK